MICMIPTHCTAERVDVVYNITITIIIIIRRK